ncbi:hypothetical protein BIV23_38835 [Streptomyces monashensis]|uniref:Uncharacterized protein n=1 Tax=Streptomyces monashensis TaxID=1678012 RepID=A0A1S2PG00_9ACTN|nr:hypothetical protein BIV23_38835 [Streptomyces monashensis]
MDPRRQGHIVCVPVGMHVTDVGEYDVRVGRPLVRGQFHDMIGESSVKMGETPERSAAREDCPAPGAEDGLPFSVRLCGEHEKDVRRRRRLSLRKTKVKEVFGDYFHLVIAVLQG